jgi:conjugal transfer mating pair stabilization protein TraN
MGANSTLATFGKGTASETSITFNPYVFGALVAIQVIQSLRSCSQQEQMLSMHMGANLSAFVKEECTKKIPIIGTCIEWTSTYCSFNSVLARLINMQGKPQLGLNTSNCQGLTVDQISKIDFTKIDFREFTGQMTQQATKNMPSNISGNYTPIMQQQSSGTKQGGSANLPSY